MMTKRICFILALVLLLLPLNGCRQTPNPDGDSSTNGETQFKTSDYQIKEVSGQHYLVFDNEEAYTNGYSSQLADLYFDSLDDMKKAILEKTLTYGQRATVRQVFARDENGTKICDLNNLYVPVLPESAQVTQVLWSGETYSFEFVTDSGMFGFISYETPNTYEALYQKYAASTNRRYTLQTGPITVKVEEKQSGSGHSTVKMYGEQQGIYFSVILYHAEYIPDSDWLRIFHMQPEGAPEVPVADIKLERYAVKDAETLRQWVTANNKQVLPNTPTQAITWEDAMRYGELSYLIDRMKHDGLLSISLLGETLTVKEYLLYREEEEFDLGIVYQYGTGEEAREFYCNISFPSSDWERAELELEEQNPESADRLIVEHFNWGAYWGATNYQGEYRTVDGEKMKLWDTWTDVGDRKDFVLIWSYADADHTGNRESAVFLCGTLFVELILPHEAVVEDEFLGNLDFAVTPFLPQ